MFDWPLKKNAIQYGLTYRAGLESTQNLVLVSLYKWYYYKMLKQFSRIRGPALASPFTTPHSYCTFGGAGGGWGWVGGGWRWVLGQFVTLPSSWALAGLWALFFSLLSLKNNRSNGPKNWICYMKLLLKYTTWKWKTLKSHIPFSRRIYLFKILVLWERLKHFI